MRSQAACCAVLLAVAFATPAEAAGAVTRIVVLEGFTGAPADSAARREFMAGFRSVFDSLEFACEKRAGDEWLPAEPQPNRFRLVDLAGSGETWTLALSIGVPPEVKVKRRPPPDPHLPVPRARVAEVRASRGLTIAVGVTSPEQAVADIHPAAERFNVYFAGARRIVVPSAKLPSGGYDYPWEDAGRVAARAALEVLHRASEDLPRDQRADLAPATRMQDTP